MTFRIRLILAAAVAVTFAVALASAIAYVVVRDSLRVEVDESLSDRAATIAALPFIRLVRSREPGKLLAEIPPPALGGAPGYVQLVRQSGEAARTEGADVTLPVSKRARSVAAGDAGKFFADARISGAHIRIVTAPLSNGWALQVARPLNETDKALGEIKLALFVVSLGGIGVASALGLVVARPALAPIRRLTEAMGQVTETRDLGSRITAGAGRDELNRLAMSFNTMLAALDASTRAQRQLISDASHELRTPLASLSTNIEVLIRDPDLPQPERGRLLADVVEQIKGMTALIADLVQVARGDLQTATADGMPLDLIASGPVPR